MASGKQAIVIGGSMGGLLAARVLADRFERVLVLDRDRFPAIGEQRRGVPQGRHTHGLLASGARVIESFFPGITAELVEAGAVPGDIVEKGRWFHEGGHLRQVRSGLDGLLMTRPLLEGMVRRRLLALPNVRAVEECDVTGLTMSGGRVTGVEVGGGSPIEADLVVHAAGRASHAPDWLTKAGFEQPRTDRVEIALGYTTRFFRRDPKALGGDVAVIVPPTPEGKKGGVMIAQEGGRWTVTLIAHFGGYAPTELDRFRKWARALHCPDIANVIDTAEPIGDAQTARFPASVRQRYEELARFPEGYLVFGDAICSFNPIYGQGMSVAALEAVELAQCLATNAPEGLAKAFFGRAAKVVDIPWSIAVGNDLRMPETVGPRNAGVRFINWYMSKLHAAAHRDAELSLAFHRVANLLAAPASVMSPGMVWRVVKGSLMRSGRDGGTEVPRRLKPAPQC
ncbi:MAG: hypothetical protein U0Q16_14565 [Bryobacteraceae bacterium]